MKKIAIFVVLVVLSLQSYAEDQPSLNLSDLGFSAEMTQASQEMHQKLEDRRFYLRQHQIWGLVSTGAMALAVLSGGEGGLPPEHPYFAGLAFTSYMASAVTAWLAPGLDEGHKITGGTLWHRRLAWIHVPGMILSPILGYMAAKKFEKGEKLDGPEQYHKDVAGVTAVALALAMISVSFEF